MDKNIYLSLVAPYVDRAIKETCVNCGKLKDLCNCNNFKSIVN